MWIFLGIVALVLVYAISIYNALVRQRNLAEEGFSGIDVQLKRRYDLIPNLIESVKGYMSHEKGVLEQVTAMRTKASEAPTVEARAAAEQMLSASLRQMFAVAENYPDLKASQNFQELQKQLGEIEEQIQMARRYYNATARDLNVLIEQFPSNIIAGLVHAEKKSFFELDSAAERSVPKVAFA